MNGHDDWIDAQVTAVRALTPTVREIKLCYGDAQAAPPGSHVNVRVHIDGRPDRRSYSVVSGSGSDEITIAVKLLPDSRGGSRYMWTLKPGMNLRVSRPRAHFELTHGAPHYLLVAGGIGITPMVAMVRALLHKRASVRLVYAARSAQEFAYASELVPELGSRLEMFAADEGRMPDLGREIAALPVDAQLYMCGPMGLMDAIRRLWASQGRPAALLRFETFGSSGHHPAQAFTVRVPRLGREIAVGPEQSMLDALSAAGVEVLSECRRGECGLCALDVVSVDGEVDHRDVFFSSAQHAENTKICACVSRVAGGSIAIDPAWRGDPDLDTPEVFVSKHHEEATGAPVG